MPLKVSPSTLIGIALLAAAGLLWMRQKAVPAPPAPLVEIPKTGAHPVIFLKKITLPQPSPATSIPSPEAEARYQEARELVHRRAAGEGERAELLQEAFQVLLALQNDHPLWEPWLLQRRLLQTEDLLRRAREE